MRSYTKQPTLAPDDHPFSARAPDSLETMALYKFFTYLLTLT